MLHNPKWDKKPDPMTLDSLIMWLQQQNPNIGYEYADSEECLLCQYFTAKGYKKPVVNPISFSYGNMLRRKDARLPNGFDSIASGNFCESSPSGHTFGAALGRARAFQKATA